MHVFLWLQSDKSQLAVRTGSNARGCFVLLLCQGSNIASAVQGQAPGAPKGMRMARGPDGSKGFAPGRGRPLPPQPAAASPPGSVCISYLIVARVLVLCSSDTG